MSERPHSLPFYLRPDPGPVARALFEEGHVFEFFQAVRLLERLAPDRRPVGRAGPPHAEAVRFQAQLSLSFPASAVHEVRPATADLPVPVMAVAFMGLHGPSGVLPRHYTEGLINPELLLLPGERDGQTKRDPRPLRAWLDLFNHRLISLFYRAWEKYRFYVRYERGEHAGPEPDPFTLGLFSLVGLGTPALRGRLRVAAAGAGGAGERVLARVDDLALLYYGGFFSHRPRCATSLEALLRDYFGIEARVRQFQGQWLVLDPSDQTRVGGPGGGGRLGVDAVAGERVWDVQGKLRLRLGPLPYARFDEFLPDRSPVPARKALFLLCHLVRLYVGPELDFDVQLVLGAADVPACRLDGGTHLGWNTWSLSGPAARDAEDAVFEGEELTRVAAAPEGP